MAVTSLAITQDNIYNGVDLLATDSPLKFICQLTDTAATPPYSFPDYVDVEVSDLLREVTYTGFRAFQFEKTDNICKYIFQVDKILRMVMGSFDDPETETIQGVSNLVRQFSVKFSYLALNDSVEFYAYRAARQVGQREAMIEIASNTAEIVYGFKNREVYLHYYIGGVLNDIIFDELPYNGEGMVRLRKTPTTIGNFSIEVTKWSADEEEYILDKTITLKVLPNCETGLYVKFLDSNTGYYKHWVFDRYFEGNFKHSSIGVVENFTENLLNSGQRMVGRKATPSISVVESGMEQAHIDYIVGIFTSPRIYIWRDSAWIPVSIEDGTTITKYRKGNAKDFAITFIEEELNTVTML